jgi:hypothetical protein
MIEAKGWRHDKFDELDLKEMLNFQGGWRGEIHKTPVG